MFQRMTIWRLGQFLTLLALLGVGCGNSDKPATPTAGAPPPLAPKVEGPKYPTQAQPKLRTLKLWIGSEEIIAELAVSPKEIQTGMMHRISIGETEGMLFVFSYPSQQAFWMKNTLIPLSCAYIDPDGVILETYEMSPLDEKPIASKSDRIQYVLEMKEGWFNRHKIQPGVVIRTERGSLTETFFRKR